MVENRTYQRDIPFLEGQLIEGTVRIPSGIWIYPEGFSRGGMLDDDLLAKRTGRKKKGLTEYISLGDFRIHSHNIPFYSQTKFTAFAKNERSAKRK